jgi:methyl-accepting chemotaxis protein
LFANLDKETAVKLSNVPIGKKLILAFAIVLLAIMGMGGTIFFNLQALKRSDVERSAGNQMWRDTAAAEFSMARQENSYRGFLVSRDPYYVGRVDSHRAAFKAKLQALRAEASADVILQIDAADQAADAWYQNVVVAGLALERDPATRAQALAMVGNDGVADQLMAPVESAIDNLKTMAETRLDAAKTMQRQATDAASYGLMIGLALAMMIAAGASWVLSQGIAKPVMNMVGYMRKLMAGENDIDVPCALRKDEFGQMGVAVLAFRDAAVEKLRLESEALSLRSQSDVERANNEAEQARAVREQTLVVSETAAGLTALSHGDLSHRINVEFPTDYAQLRSDFNTAMTKLEGAMGVIGSNASAMQSGAGEISQAADDLSRRTEQQAATLEETAAALDEITATVKRTAEGAERAGTVVVGAKVAAEQSGVVVGRAVAAMGEIERSSDQISQIIGVIDEIAFQTNLLALNAGVEAARAGDAGRGFAVVASEVRALAQRSAEAAKEIKGLIAASSGHVKDGVGLVGETGQALTAIVERVSEINGLMAEITASAQEQATALSQVNTAVNQMDQTTQQNAAMVEQSTAASHNLSQEAEELAVLVGKFHVSQDGRGAGQPARAKPNPVRQAQARIADFARQPSPAPVRRVASGGAALAQSAEPQWEQF